MSGSTTGGHSHGLPTDGIERTLQIGAQKVRVEISDNDTRLDLTHDDRRWQFDTDGEIAELVAVYECGRPLSEHPEPEWLDRALRQLGLVGHLSP